MKTSGRLVVYVTNHGFGHLNRTVAVLNRLPLEVPVSIRCHPDLFPHWGERLLRPADLESYVSDAGTISPIGDSMGTDALATLDRAARLHDEMMHRLPDEIALLRSAGAAAVLCDAPWVPIVAAEQAGIPALVLANFLWSEIYEEHAEALGPAYRELVDRIRGCYRRATVVFRAEPALRMNNIARQIDVGMVVTPGRDRRAELRQGLGLEPNARVASLYVGRYGQTALPWVRLTEWPDLHFVTYHPLPEEVGPLPNVHVLEVSDWTGSDLAASVDLAIAKAGYGAVCEAMANGTPFLYPPRSRFAEFACLDQALRQWGGGIPLTEREFAELDLTRALPLALRRRPGTPPFLAGGASRVADLLVSHCRSASDHP